MNALGRFVRVFLAIAVAVGATAQRMEPSDATLDSLQFKPTDSILSNEADRFQQVYQVWQLTRAFEVGKNAVSSYKEPVLTRGSRGIALFRQASPAVVLVVVGKVENGQFQFSGLGAGAIIDSRGYIISNWHVINGFQNALIFFKPTGSAEPSDNAAVVARVIAGDAVKDLALLRLIDPPAALTVLPLALEAKVEVAEDVHIIGHPRGNYWSYSTGVISQYRPAYDWSYSDGSHHHANVLQMQTAINPGNSGGPVLNDLGQIVGLVAMSEEGQNLNYAISLDEIRQFLSANLPAKTRATQTLPVTPEVTMSFADAQTADKHRVTRAVASNVEIIVYTFDSSWRAIVKGVGDRPLEVRSTADPQRWILILPSGKTLVVQFESGSPARISSS